jgi:hypothetical protein
MIEKAGQNVLTAFVIKFRFAGRSQGNVVADAKHNNPHPYRRRSESDET